MKRTPAQRKAIRRRAKRYAAGLRSTQYNLMRCAVTGNAVALHAFIVTAYEAGYKAGNVATVRAPAAALLHVLDTQRELKAKIVQLRAALRALGDTAMREASL